MKIGVISDTHGDVGATRQAVRLLDSLGVLLTIHCGDVGREILHVLGGRQTHFVHGNMDADPLDAWLTDPRHAYYGCLGSLELEGRRIAFLHGHDIKLLHDTIHSGQWDLVCHGHTHSYATSREGRTLVLNPGALSRTCWPSLAVVELPSLDVMQLPL